MTTTIIIITVTITIAIKITINNSYSNYNYNNLVYTKTVDNVEGTPWLAGQTPNILCYLTPSNSEKNGV